jgi:hypothetical protein
MKIASRLSATVAAFALVLVGLTVVTPSTARAAVGEEWIAFGIFGAAAVAAIIVIENQNDDEQPQSP